MSNLKMGYILVISLSLLLGCFSYSFFKDVINGIEKEDFFVFASSNNYMKEFFANAKVTDSEYLKGSAIVNNYRIVLDIALTDKQVQEGLAIKNSLNENEGMLFFLGEPQKASFWMKNMKFPIDIIWLNENFSIVHIEQELQPCESVSYCKSYKPNSEALYVLETTAGFTKRHNLQIGDNVDFQLIK
ncbi:MAG TPA: DUF192 domain-containing protein [Nitrososphaeraceae archaeon]|nr:DUF192 domain-containing protein [Nitrososphaeraceae archaeon]